MRQTKALLNRSAWSNSEWTLAYNVHVHNGQHTCIVKKYLHSNVLFFARVADILSLSMMFSLYTQAVMF